MPVYVVERTYDPPISPRTLYDLSKLLAPCNAARDIKWLVTHFSDDGSRAVCMYEAFDAERVREANRVAGLAFDRVWAANVQRP